MEDFHRLIAQPLKMNRPTLDSENSTFFKTHEIKYTTSTMFKRHYIDEIEYPPSPICSGNPQFELNITSFQFLPKTSRLSVLAGITPSMTCIPEI